MVKGDQKMKKSEAEASSQSLADKTLRLTWTGRAPGYVFNVGVPTWGARNDTWQLELRKHEPKEVHGKELHGLLSLVLEHHKGNDNVLLIFAMQQAGELKIEEVKA